MADKPLFILVYQKTHPLQTMHALQFAMSQPHAHYLDSPFAPRLATSAPDLGMQPERDARRVVGHPLTWEGAPDLAIDGTERRRQRPVEPTKQREHYSGKKKAHTDKNILLVTSTTSKVVYLGPTEPGKTHDKKAADQAQLAYPINAMLDKDTGFQGYEPAGL